MHMPHRHALLLLVGWKRGAPSLTPAPPPAACYCYCLPSGDEVEEGEEEGKEDVEPAGSDKEEEAAAAPAAGAGGAGEDVHMTRSDSAVANASFWEALLKERWEQLQREDEEALAAAKRDDMDRWGLGGGRRAEGGRGVRYGQVVCVGGGSRGGTRSAKWDDTDRCGCVGGVGWQRYLLLP